MNWLISWFWRIEVVKGLDSLLSFSSLCLINGRIVAIQVYPPAFHVWMKCCNACSGTLTSRSIDGWCQLGKSRYFISRLACPGPGKTWGFLVRSCMEDRNLASWYSQLDVIEFQGLTGTSCVGLPGSESLFAQQLLSRSSALISVSAKMAVKSQITATLFSESNLEHGPLQNLSVCEGVFGLGPFLRNVRAPFGLVWCERKPPATFCTGVQPKMVSQWCFLPHPLALKLPALRMETPASHHINMTFGLPSYRWERSSLGDLAVRSLQSNFMKVCLTQVTSLYSGWGSCTAQRWGCDSDWYTKTFSAQNARGEGQLWEKRIETTRNDHTFGLKRHDMHVFPTITCVGQLLLGHGTIPPSALFAGRPRVSRYLLVSWEQRQMQAEGVRID